jgi:streptogramin lyase
MGVHLKRILQSDNNLLYKCNPKENKLEFKSLYFYTQTTQINKFNTIKSLESSGYKNLGSPENLLIRNSKGFVASTKLINLDCKINNHAYQATIGSSPGNTNPMGNCGAFSSFWATIKDNGKIILPKLLFQECGSDSAVAEIIVKPNKKVQILKTNPYEQNEGLSPMDTNRQTIYVGQAPSSIAQDPFGNIWVGNYQSKDIVKINQAKKEFKYNLNAPVESIAVDQKGNVFCIAGNHIVKLNQQGMIIGTYYITQNPNYIYIDPKNNVWVDDWKSGELFKLSTNGTILNRYLIGGGPYQMVMDQAGNLWIVESYGTLAVLYSNGYLKECPSGVYAKEIVAKDNSIWIAQGSLLGSGPYLRQISYNCSFLPQSYKLNIQPAGLAIDNEGNIWVSGSTKYGGGYLEELSKTGEYKHIYALDKFPGPLTIDRYGNVWVISGPNTVTEFYKAALPQNNATINQGSGVNPHLPIAIHHTFPENNIGK